MRYYLRLTYACYLHTVVRVTAPLLEKVRIVKRKKKNDSEKEIENFKEICFTVNKVYFTSLNILNNTVLLTLNNKNNYLSPEISINYLY